MKLIKAGIGVVFMLLAVACRADGGEINPSVVAELVRKNAITFTSIGGLTVWVTESESFSTKPLLSKGWSEYPSVAQLEEIEGVHPRPGPPQEPPPPTRSPHPHPIPIPPGPQDGSGLRPPEEKDSIMNLAEKGVIVGRLHTERLSLSSIVLRGDYTMVLTKVNGLPVAALVDADGRFVCSFSNIFLTAANPCR